MIKRLLPLLSLGLAGCLTQVAAEEPPEGENYVGMNTNFVADWSANNTFSDIMRHARAWKNASWNGSVATDPEGWPMGDCSTVMFGNGNHTGTYKLIFEGQAASISPLWVNGTISNKQYNASTNTTTADFTLNSVKTGGLVFTGTKRQPSDPSGTGITDVRLYRPGEPTDGSALLSSEFVNLMDPFHVVRYMNWGHTNTNPLVTWAQRPRPGDAMVGDVTIDGRTGRIGQPIEYMVEASNELNADMWICIPVYANSDYVTKMAQTIRYGSDGVDPYTSGAWDASWKEHRGLNPNLNVYVEYGNEIWNTAGGFMTYSWTKEQSDAIRNDGVLDHPIEFDGATDQYTILARYSAYRLVEASNAFRSVFGASAMNTQVRPVLMGQITGNWFNPRQLPWLEDFYGTYRSSSHQFPNTNPHPVSYYMYGAGGSGYYGVETWSGNPNTFFGSGNYPTSGYDELVANEAIMCMNYGLKRIAYEGGMGLDGGGGTLSESEKETLNADPRMQDLTESYHEVWSQNGGDLLVYFVNVGDLNWEFTWDVDVTNSPKLEATDNLIGSQRASVTSGPTIPATIVARDQDDYRTSQGGTFASTIQGLPCVGGIDGGDWTALAFNSPSSGTATVNLRVASNSSQVDAEITINGISEGTIQFAGQGNGTLINTSSITVPVNAGFNVVRVGSTSGSFNLRSVNFTALNGSGGGGGSTPSITTTSLPSATQGSGYSSTLSASGGDAPLSWYVSNGSLPAGLSLSSSGTINGTPTATGTSYFTVGVSDDDSDTDTQNLSIVVNASGGSSLTGTLDRAWWTGLSGEEISVLTNSSDFPSSPDGTDTLSNGFEAVGWSGSSSPGGSTDWANQYGERIYGYIVPPTTGSYVFWIAGDNDSDLYLSTDSSSGNASRIAYVDGWTNQYEWNKNGSQKSSSVSLTAGEPYYVEVLHKEHNAGDHVAIGWAKPGQSTTSPSEVVPSSALSAYSAGVPSGSGGGGGTPTVTTTSLPGATQGSSYSETLSASGGDAPLSWSIAGGSLPSGLSLSSGGTISGTPTTTGTIYFTVRVTDDDGEWDNQNLSITIAASGGGGGGSLSWSGQDVGSVSAAGSFSENSGTFTIDGSGADIWGANDEFYFVSLDSGLSGDGTITARVVSMDSIHAWQKIGVMMRNGTAANAQHAMTAVSLSNGVAFQYRTTTSGTSGSATTSGSDPYWVRLERSGNTFTSYDSSNGSNWTQIGSQTISMPTNIEVGLCVTSHNDGTLCTAEIDNVDVQ